MNQPYLPGIFAAPAAPDFVKGRRRLRDLPVHTNGPQTERDAAKRAKGTAGSNADAVFEILSDHGPMVASAVASWLCTTTDGGGPRYPQFYGYDMIRVAVEVRRRLNDLLNLGLATRTDHALPGEREVRWTATTQKGD